MMRKGSSRKGQRRRRVVASLDDGDDGSDFMMPAPEIPIKLDLGTAGIVKEIARMEVNPEQQAALEERLPKDGELSWGQNQAPQEHRRVWWSFAGAITLMFAAIAGVNHGSRENHGTNQSIPQGIIVFEDHPDEDSQLFALMKNSYRKQQQAVTLFRQFTAAKKRAEILPLIRISDITSSMLEKHWKPWPSTPLLDQQDQLQFDFDETQGRAFLSMGGKNADGSSFLAFFVPDGDELKLDWEASMQLGEARLSSLARFPTENPVTVRVLLSPSAYYLPTLPESEFESYQLTCLHDDTVVWGYVRRDSPEHQRIRELLRIDSELLEHMQELRVTVRLKKTDDLSSQNRFFITEMLHKDWVMP